MSNSNYGAYGAYGAGVTMSVGENAFFRGESIDDLLLVCLRDSGSIHMGNVGSSNAAKVVVSDNNGLVINSTHTNPRVTLSASNNTGALQLTLVSNVGLMITSNLCDSIEFDASSNIIYRTSNLAANATNVSLRTSNLSIESQYVTYDTSNLVVNASSNIIYRTSNLDANATNVSLRTSNL